MDLRKVKKLIELFEESDLAEMEISEGDATIRMSRGASVINYTASAPPMPAGDVPVSPRPAVDSRVEDPSRGIEESQDSIDSPMVGTFYLAPSPDADPFVEIGSTVKPGDVLCVIEAMKTFNQLECEVSGTITKILKSSGDPVEYGEPLFLIK